MRKSESMPIGTRGDGVLPPITVAVPMAGTPPAAYRGRPGAVIPGHQAPRPLQHGVRIDWKHTTRGGS
jgi:hypothetical protein